MIVVGLAATASSLRIGPVQSDPVVPLIGGRGRRGG